jgi:Trypsin
MMVVGLLSATAGVALAVVGGKTVSVTAAPWTVVVWEQSPYKGQPRYAACTGVIIDPLRVLTAGHCVMSGDSAKPLPSSAFTIEAGVSNFEHPPSSDHPQFRSVRAVRTMPGYIALRRVTSLSGLDAVAHDLAVLTLSRPLDLSGDDARAANLPNGKTPVPTGRSRLVIAGFGEEKDGSYGNGTLNEVTKPKVFTDCENTQVLCTYETTNTCYGDSGLGAVEPGPHPTVIGILSESFLRGCGPGLDAYAPLSTPASLRFISNR